MQPLDARRLTASLALLGLALVLTLGVCASIGGSRASVLDVILPDRGAVAPDLDPDLARAMILRVRLPRLLLAALAGAALGAAGTAFQAVLRNPLADPYILGISGGAALGAIAATAAGLPALLPFVPVREGAAFLGALLTVAFIFGLSSVRGRIVSYPMLLIGVVMNAIFLALILFIETAVEFTRIQGVMLWMVGNVPTVGYDLIALLSCVLLVGVVAIALLGRDLNLLSAGEEVARTLGVSVERTRIAAVVLASLVTAAVVSVTGLIGFVGLIVPHAARLLFGPDHRLLVPASALTGAIFLMAADTAARTVMAPTELPVGVITALCGGPFFLWLYREQRGASYFE
ncbi:MAG TPA: iron ABC transporter permease [Candidatus Polarisedimenticolia bacterium]|nr:iron ABC transporter permease [Candidatus Polarisedimenticolia bacterium]